MKSTYERMFMEVLASDLKAGDKIKNTNKDCEHSGSKGVVISVKKLPKKDCSRVKNKNNMPGRLVKYKVTNSDKNYEPGDVLYKTGDQLERD